MIKTFILAAGEGTRLRPLTREMPKPMVPINGVPLLEIIIGQLRRQGLTDLIINLHHRPEAITGYFGNGSQFGVNIRYSYEEALLGTAGGVKKVAAQLTDTFFVVYGDVLTNLNYQRLLAFHRRQKALVSLSLYRVNNPTEVGLVGTDANGRITAFVEKPAADEVFTDLANAGILVCEPAVLDWIPPDTVFDFGRDLLPQLLMAGQKLAGLPIEEETYLLDIGSPEKYARAQQEWPAVDQPGSV